DKPIETPNYLKWNPKGASDGELVFVAGNPGSTQRLNTVAQLEFDRDQLLPNELNMIRRRIRVLRDFSKTSAEHERQAASEIFNLENAVKELNGEKNGLDTWRVMENKRKDEEKFKVAVFAKPELKEKYGSAWDEIAASQRKAATRVKERFYRSTDSR